MKILNDNEIKERQDKLEKKAKDMKNIGCGVIAAILFILLLVYCLILVGGAFD